MKKWGDSEYANSIKYDILKGGNMAKKEVEDDFSDIEDIGEDEEEEIVEERQLPKPKPKPQPIAKQTQSNQNRYVAVHQEALEAVLDNNTNRAQANIFEILVDILNKLEEVKKAVSG